MPSFFRNDRDKSQSPEAVQRTAPRVEWADREGWKTFGDRLNFLSPEKAHLQTGRLSILPPRNPEKRKEPKT